MKKLILLSILATLILTACEPKEFADLNSSIAVSDVNIVDVPNGKIKPNQIVIKTEQAFAVFEWNVEAYPNSPYPAGMFANALVKTGDLSAAHKKIQQALEIASTQDHPSLGYFRLQNQRLDLDEDIFQKIEQQ